MIRGRLGYTGEGQSLTTLLGKGETVSHAETETAADDAGPLPKQIPLETPQASSLKKCLDRGVFESCVLRDLHEDIQA